MLWIVLLGVPFESDLVNNLVRSLIWNLSRIEDCFRSLLFLKKRVKGRSTLNQSGLLKGNNNSGYSSRSAK